MSDLVGKMRDLAARTPVHAAELRQKADALEIAVEGFFGEIQTVPVTVFIGTWARARGLYCKITGEPLV